MLRHGVERFPSLVEAALAAREPEWRAKDEAREMKGGGWHGARMAREGVITHAFRLEARRLYDEGMGVKPIAKLLKASPSTVRRALQNGRAA